MAPSLRKNVLATITYYDALGYPLTAFEAWKYYMQYHDGAVPQKTSYHEVLGKLEVLQSEGLIACQNGMWFLASRKALVPERMWREKISAQKLRRMRKLVKMLRFVPFVRMIAATGSLSYRHGNKNSDWDMLVVMESGALFTGRFFLTLFLQLIGKRRHGQKVVDRACLNYYTTTKKLSVPLEDWYAAHEYQVIAPLFETFSTDVFFRANAWLPKLRPNALLPLTPYRLGLQSTPASSFFQKIGEMLTGFSWLENRLKNIQQKKIASNPKTKLPGACIIAEEDTLVFFPKPRGPKIYEAFYSKLTW
jgi:hypothetical protein